MFLPAHKMSMYPIFCTIWVMETGWYMSGWSGVPIPKPELNNYLPQFVAGVQKFAIEKDIHYDLIHSHYWLSGIAGEALKESWQKPLVHMFHTLGLMKNRVARSPSEMEGDYRIDGEKRVIKAADRIIAATPARKSQLQFLYQVDERKITIIPPGVDTSHFYPIPVMKPERHRSNSWRLYDSFCRSD